MKEQRKKTGGEVFDTVDGPNLIRPSEVARMLGVSSGWVRDHATRKTPRIPVIRIGRMLRFRRDDINAIIQQGFSS